MSRRRQNEKDQALELLGKAREGKIDMEEVAINCIAQDGFDDIDDIDIEDLKNESIKEESKEEVGGKKMVQQKLVIEGKINPEVKEMIKEKTEITISKEKAPPIKMPKKFILNVPKKTDTNVLKNVPIQNLDFFYIDLVSVTTMKGCVFLIGKVKGDNGFISCSILVKGIRRVLFVEPKNEFVNKPKEVIEELKRHYKSTNVVFVEATKEMIINPQDTNDNKELLEKRVIKGIQVECYFDDKELNDTGKTYEKVYQKTLTCEEVFLSNYSIFGPSWIKFNGLTVVRTSVEQKSWCLREYILDLKKVNPKTSIKTSITNTLIPPLNICSIETICLNEEKTKKPMMVSLDVVKSVPMSHSMKAWRDDVYTFYINQGVKCSKGMEAKDQRELLLKVCNFIQQHDIDLIISHDMTTTLMPFFDIIESSGEVSAYSKFGRLKRTLTNIKSKDNKDGTFAGKTFFSGRLLADTFVLSKEFLKSEKINDLNTLTSHYLGIQREYNIDDLTCSSDIELALQDKNKIENIRNYLEENSRLVIKLCNQMNAIAMTKELTNLAGNIWSHSFFGKRAERVEYLLLHEFIKQTTLYILPDKKFGEGSQHKKYAGGLVLEPVKDFYSDPILLIDFKSLYPSIIMEFGVCFLNSQLGGENNKSMLPEIIKKLVMRRRQIVSEMERLGDKDEIKKAQLNTQQLSVKVMTNSIYGCLGFKGSRFYCQKIAEWITGKGRTILTNTCEQVQKMDIQVIYGDTDSLMVRPPKISMNDLKTFGNNLCAQINKSYKSLEIEIDAIFEKLLLLRKKRYAATMILDGGKKKKELKGLDVVRREWCPLSKEIGYYCIDLILSDPGLVKMQQTLEIYFKNMAEKLRSGKVDIHQLVITKGLNKDPQSYPQKIDHVAAALKSSKHYKAGDQVKYLIEKGDNTKSSSDRSIPLDVVEKLEKFEPDYEYYLDTQIYAPVSRLFEVFPSMNIKIREWLGLNPTTNLYSRIVVTTNKSGLWLGFEIECSECKKVFTYRAYQERDMKCRCPECKKLYTSTDLVSKGKQYMEKILDEYLKQEVSCNDCGRIYTKAGNNAVYDDSFDCCGKNYEFNIKKSDVIEKLTSLYVITSSRLNDQQKIDYDIDALHSSVKGFLDKPCLQRGR
ncbi:hypothetical protein ENUP19_0047G0235 [Entamoeba nuttalli]|uniref:DNA polymerase n=2 Tax=Entamoeba nuttalli TaxID=412467 RepID=K2H130_ENTNP|nr:DNA polymerase alpha catalytic subunit, putative [Entamoeba nuttalli P19]EKE41203.1 DNA polymerase alpha catalytic subunit, putative [Entamoeba nuttalli P19]|eukprot:XP_008856469.1 DNA polymerase alpha catalytic subunit, putative [Entamoeba nuttalli P19]